ncbi:hypothetical protein [Enterococcus termitis]|uniref:MacB-like periplasmic core domain-containing protein n=1 Tax=Enterococcus termitis TaxID=332950 RepID=A0A1E5GDF3_9ENTE|nr:hypothetical protein [Enterococcus termitis]OEG10615.1 hypothetical protein BCR25_09115 [Enterococcus termitis]
MGNNLIESKNKDMFSITDTLTNPDDFYAFRQSEQKLLTVKNFYDNLNNHSTIKFLSAFDQPLQIENFKGGNIFNESYGNDDHTATIGTYVDDISKKEVFDVKSIQMNKNFYDYYAIELDENATFQWNTISFEKNVYPIALGANYKGLYKKGDILKGSLYFREFDFEVVGFIKENTSVFYKNDINKYLDDYILIPYPEKFNITPSNKEFIGMVSFSMMAGDIIVSKDDGLSYLQKQLAITAKKTDFYDYTILGVSTFSVQYNTMYELINYNKKLITSVCICIFICTIFIILFLNFKIYNRRSLRYFISYLNGDTFEKIYVLGLRDLILGDVFIVMSYISLFFIIPNRDIFSFLNILSFILVFIFVDALMLYHLLKKDIYSNFNTIQQRSD